MALTAAQLQTLKNSIAAASDLVTTAGGTACLNYVGRAINSLSNDLDSNTCIAAMYRLPASPIFTVWKTIVPIGEVGRAFNTTELAGLTSLNTQRLQNLAAWLAAGVNPSLASDRAFFDDVFSGAGGTNTRAALAILWRRQATRFEQLYATGTGSDPSPATLVVEGSVSALEINAARNLP